MTEPERRQLRLFIDQAVRERVEVAVVECAYCGAAFKPKDRRQRFCKPSHRVNAHRKTERGRAMWNAYRRRRDKQRREVTA